MIKQDFKEISFKELVQYFQSTGEKSFRAQQVFDWIYQKGVLDFSEMKNLSSELRRALDSKFTLQSLMPEKVYKSSDGTQKVLFSLHDKETIETVLIPTEKRSSVCVSTQAGCKFGCQFCASGLLGFKRNLTCAEIVEQILQMKKISSGKAITHIVFMGVGEPFDNYDNLFKAIRLINAKDAMHIAARRITISSCGLVPGIKKFSQEDLQVELAISLHASNDDLRNKIMPINKKYPLKELMAACRAYYKKTNRQITFEYLLIKDVTCNEKAVRELRNLLKGFDSKLNLIRYNDVCEFSYKAPAKKEILSFQKSLNKAGLHSILRMPRGQDIFAACGQLRLR